MIEPLLVEAGKPSFGERIYEWAYWAYDVIWTNLQWAVCWILDFVAPSWRTKMITFVQLVIVAAILTALIVRIAPTVYKIAKKFSYYLLLFAIFAILLGILWEYQGATVVKWLTGMAGRMIGFNVA